jgi:glutamate dehydrogenase (NADP+)
VDREKLDYVLDLKNVRRGRIKEYADKFKGVKYYEGKSVWDVIADENIQVDLAFPSATENEINGDQAKALVENGCYCVSEGANMPSTLDAIKFYQENNVLYGPAKAANAGGVATSGLEMSQNSLRLSWDHSQSQP